MTAETETPTEYTPSTAEIREYVEVGGEPRPWMPPEPAMDAARAAAFDRWLSAHDREVAARAWDEGLDAAARVLVLPERAVQPDNPYRENGQTNA